MKGEKLAAIFTSLARQITENPNLRAGMKLTLEPIVDNGAAFAHWVEVIGDIIETVITEGEFTDTPRRAPTRLEPVRRHYWCRPRIRDRARRCRPRNPHR